MNSNAKLRAALITRGHDPSEFEDLDGTEIGFLDSANASRVLERMAYNLVVNTSAAPKPPAARRAIDAIPLTGLVEGRPMQKAQGAVKPDSQGILGRERYKRSDAAKALEEIATYDPDASLSIWNLRRLAFKGWKRQAYKIVNGEETEEPDEGATKYLRALDKRVGKLYGDGVEGILLSQTKRLATAGGIATEIELAPNLRDIIDFHPVDSRIVFIAVNPATGQLDYAYRKESNELVFLSPEQFKKIPLDPDQDRPYGEPLLLPALTTYFPMQEGRKSFGRVVANQGWGKVAVELDWELCSAQAKTQLRENINDPEAVRKFMERYISDVKAQFDNADPDSSWIHWSWAKPDTLGADHSRHTLSPKETLEALDAPHIAALKSHPALQGRSYGNSLSTNGDIHASLYALTVEAIRKPLFAMDDWLCSQALRFAGLSAYSRASADKIRDTDAVSESAADLNRATYWAMLEDRGYVTADQASTELTGHDAQGERLETSQNAPQGATEANSGRRETSLAKDEDSDRIIPWEVVSSGLKGRRRDGTGKG